MDAFARRLPGSALRSLRPQCALTVNVGAHENARDNRWVGKMAGVAYKICRHPTLPRSFRPQTASRALRADVRRAANAWRVSNYFCSPASL